MNAVRAQDAVADVGVEEVEEHRKEEVGARDPNIIKITHTEYD
jgi:hypothetical protein